MSRPVYSRLAKSPENVDALRNIVGADKKLFDRSIDVGINRCYLVGGRHRGRNIVLNPVYFSVSFANIVSGFEFNSLAKHSLGPLL